MTTFNQFKFERTDTNSTLTLEVNADGCQEIYHSFQRKNRMLLLYAINADFQNQF